MAEGTLRASQSSISASASGAATPNVSRFPPGVEPVQLTPPTLKIFNIVINENISKEKPYISIPRNALLHDVDTRQIMSDFFPLRAKIEAYPGSEMLLVYDEEQKFKKNFYLHISQEGTINAVEKLGSGYSDLLQKALSPASSRTPSRTGMRSRAVSTRHIGDKDGPTGWVSQGSDQEIIAESCSPSRELLKLSISRRRNEFGAPCKFVDSDAHDGLVECRQFRNPNFDLIRMEQDVGVQAVPVMVDITVQTAWYGKVNSATQFEPYANKEPARDLDSAEPSKLASFLSTVAQRLEYSLQQNETVDIFKDDFRDVIDEDIMVGDKADNSLKEFQSFTDYEFSNGKYISSLDWKPDAKGVVSVACTEKMDPDEAPSVSGLVAPSVILVWDFVDPINPQLILEAPSDILQFRYHPRRPNLLVAALVNGQVAVWDTTVTPRKVLIQKSKSNVGEDEDIRRTVTVIPFVVCSSIEQSHRKPATSLSWLGNVSVGPDGALTKAESNCFVTTSCDGQVLFWDTTRFIHRDDATSLQEWAPVYRIPLFDVVPGPEGGELKQPVVYANTAHLLCSEEHTTLYLGTLQGELLHIDWNDIVAGRAAQSIRSTQREHVGTIVSVQPSPLVPDVLLTAADWTIHLWRDGISRALVSSPYAGSPVTCVRWSPTRASVLFVGKQDGTVDIWDLLDKSHIPSLTQHVCSSVTTMEFMYAKASDSAQQPGKEQDTSVQLLAVGDSQGRLHILEVPRNLAHKVGQKTSEKSLLQNFLKREEKRVSYVERRRAQDAPTAAAAVEEEPALPNGHNAGDLRDNKDAVEEPPPKELTTADL